MSHGGQPLCLGRLFLVQLGLGRIQVVVNTRVDAGGPLSRIALRSKLDPLNLPLCHQCRGCRLIERPTQLIATDSPVYLRSQADGLRKVSPRSSSLGLTDHSVVGVSASLAGS